MLYEGLTEWFVYGIQAMINLMSQYFENEGFTPVQIGTIVTVGRIMSLAANPFWFKMKSKIGSNKVITILTLTPMLTVWGIYFMPNFEGKLVFMIISGFFLAVVLPIIEGKVVASLMRKGIHFNPSRLLGSIGFSVAAFIAGLLFNFGFFMLFVMLSTILFIVFFLNRKIKAANSKSAASHTSDEKGNWKIFAIMLITGILGLSSAIFYVTFLPVFVRSRGYGVSFTGFSFFIFALSEIPFLLLSRKLIEKMGEIVLMSTGVIAAGLRIVLSPLAQSPFQLMFISLLHGWGYIVIYYTIYHFIHYHMPLKDTNKAQSVFWMSMTGFGFILGSFGGGFIVELFGLEQSFIYVGAFVLLLSVFTVIWAVMATKSLRIT